jgi:hypothetical protein
MAIKMSIRLFAQQWNEVKQRCPGVQLYLLVGAGQRKDSIKQLKSLNASIKNRCLLMPPQDDEGLEDFAPHLCWVPLPEEDPKMWNQLLVWLADHPLWYTIIASSVELEPLSRHLRAYMDAVLEGNMEILLAYWDPVVFGMLLGQQEDSSLYVKGPVLTPEQQAGLFRGIESWWYVGRTRDMYQHLPPTLVGGVQPATAPLQLTQAQEDLIIEAGLPDEVLGNIKENLPNVLKGMEPPEQYIQVKQEVLAARELGLNNRQEIVLYVEIALQYQGRMKTNFRIGDLLAEVRTRNLTIQEAVSQFPPLEEIH